MLLCAEQQDAEFKKKQREQQKAMEEAKQKAAGKGPIGLFLWYGKSCFTTFKCFGKTFQPLLNVEPLA